MFSGLGGELLKYSLLKQTSLNFKNRDFEFKSSDVFHIIFLTIISLILFYFSKETSEIKAILWGMHPNHYVNTITKSELFKNDFPVNIEGYSSSLYMNTYVVLNNLFDVPVAFTADIFMLMQAFLLVFALNHLVHSFDGNKIMAALVILIFLTNNLPGSNLANFGDGLRNQVQPLYYGFAQAFRLFSISYFLRGNAHLGLTCVFMSIVGHPIIGLSGCILILGIIVANPRNYCSRTALPAYITFVLCVVAYGFVFILPMITNIQKIDLEDFVLASRSFSYHWHPVTQGYFGKYWTKELLPVLGCLAIICAAVSLPTWKNRSKTKGVFYGSLLIVLATSIGIIFSDIFPKEFFIKLAIHRSTDQITMLGTIIGALICYSLVSSSKPILLVVGIVWISSLIFTSKTDLFIPIWCALIGAICYLASDYPEKSKQPKKLRYYLTICLFCLLSVCLIVASYLSKSDQLYRLSGQTFLIAGLLTLCVFSKQLLVMMFPTRSWTHYQQSHLIQLFCILIVLTSLSNNFRIFREKHSYQASDFLAVQLWAKHNTPEGSLFLVDPSWRGGWREYSERPSFGSYQEWGYTSFTYISKYENYKEGLRRFALFDVYPIEIAKLQIRNNATLSRVKNIVRRKLNDNFNSMPLSQMYKIGSEEGVSYLVVRRDHFKGNLVDHNPVYQQGEFAVFEIPFENTAGNIKTR